MFDRGRREDLVGVYVVLKQNKKPRGRSPDSDKSERKRDDSEIIIRRDDDRERHGSIVRHRSRTSSGASYAPRHSSIYLTRQPSSSRSRRPTKDIYTPSDFVPVPQSNQPPPDYGHNRQADLDEILYAPSSRDRDQSYYASGPGPRPRRRSVTFAEPPTTGYPDEPQVINIEHYPGCPLPPGRYVGYPHPPAPYPDYPDQPDVRPSNTGIDTPRGWDRRSPIRIRRSPSSSPEPTPLRRRDSGNYVPLISKLQRLTVLSVTDKSYRAGDSSTVSARGRYYQPGYDVIHANDVAEQDRRPYGEPLSDIPEEASDLSMSSDDDESEDDEFRRRPIRRRHQPRETDQQLLDKTLKEYVNPDNLRKRENGFVDDEPSSPVREVSGAAAAGEPGDTTIAPHPTPTTHPSGSGGGPGQPSVEEEREEMADST